MANLSARMRYGVLTGNRSTFLDKAVECSMLTLPYLIRQDSGQTIHQPLPSPWQSIGAKSVVALASKLMLALLPPQTTFFKLQIRDDKLNEELDPQIKSELDLSFNKIERMVMDYVNASNDRVVVHEAIKHLIVGGNALIFMNKEGLKHYPLNRYVVNRDGDGNVIEIVTKELIAKELVPIKEPKPNAVSGGGGLDANYMSTNEDVEVYTYVRMDSKSGRWVWHQEAYDQMIPNSRSTAPKNASPWLVLRFNTVDGEEYGRGRVEEFLGDLRSLEALTQALVEGSAAAAKVIFLVSPSSTTKPQTLAKAGNGAIVQGRPEDVQVVQVGKTADFRTAAEMATQLEKRIADAFLILQVRQSERTTAEEVRLTQLELERQLGGLFSLLTTEFLVPYLNRTMLVLQRGGQLPKIPKDLVRPQIVAGVNALGRGQDRESLITFVTTIAQTMGPEAIQKFIDPTEYIKRLAAAQGIDYLYLVKTPEQIQGEMQQQQQMELQREMVGQAGQFASAPALDPSKNPELNGNESNAGQQQSPQTPDQAIG